MQRIQSATRDPGLRRRIGVVCLLVAAVAVVFLGPLADGARSGIYRAAQCHGGHGGGDHSGARFGHAGAEFYASVDCAPGLRGLGIAIPQGGGYGAIGAWAIDAPQGTVFHSVSFAGSRYSAHGWLSWFVGWKPEGGYDDLWMPDNAQTYDYPDSYQRSGPFTSIEAQIVCVQVGGCAGSLLPGIYMHDLAFDVSDTAPPAVAGAGSLLAAGVKRGSQDVTVAANDQGGGLTAAWVLVNGIAAASQPYPCAVAANVAANLRPCPGAASPSFDLDTQSYPFHDGANSVQVCASDLATISAPNVSCAAASQVEVDNSCQGSQVAGGSQLSASFADTGEYAIRVQSDQGANVTGRLTDAHGNGVAGATLCVRERTMLPDAAVWPVGTLQTDSSGHFEYRVDPGPNREISFGYRFNRDQIEAGVEFRAEAIPTLGLSPHKLRNGHAIRLFGSLPGPANAGRVVVFQARYPGHRRWHTFRKAETDTHGHFQSHYRFQKTTTTTRYRIRALVPAQTGYPYLEGHSAPRRVKVLG